MTVGGRDYERPQVREVSKERVALHECHELVELALCDLTKLALGLMCIDAEVRDALGLEGRGRS